MRYFILLIFFLFGGPSMAQDWEDQRVFKSDTPTQNLRVLSSTDTSFFEPIIKEFITNNTDVSVEYLVSGTADIDRLYRANPDDFDVVISSAMDLQLKLVNDGLAFDIAETNHPAWAQWRNSLFAFTTEPAAIVINRTAFKGYDIPETRQDLIQALRARPEMFRGKLGTYDVRQSGLGYLFATQDARATETYWRLMEVMGSLDAKLYCCSGQMIDDLSSGKIVVAYNVLGSYASARRNEGSDIEIILPSDFPTTMMRTAMVAKSTEKSEIATAFLRHLISLQSETTGAIGTLPPLVSNSGQSTIALEPALMTYLDKLKRKTFIAEWESAIIQ